MPCITEMKSRSKVHWSNEVHHQSGREVLQKPSLTELSCDERRVHTRPTRATGHVSCTPHDPVHSARLLRDGRIDGRSLIHVSPLLRRRRNMLAAAHEHTGKQIGIETQMKQRHNLPNVCVHSLRVNFMVIGAATLNLFTTTVIGYLLLLLLCAGAGNVNMSNGLLRAMLELLCVVYHRLRGSRTLERRSIVCSCRAVVTSG